MTEEKNLIELIREIDPNLKFEKVLGRGWCGLVAKVTDGRNTYRLKINKFSEPEERHDTLEREYSILHDLSKTGAVPKAINLYDNISCLCENKKGKNAYLTEFIEGEVLSKTKERPSEISLTIKLHDLIGKVHQAGYKFAKDAMNPENILLGKDGNLCVIDPMYLIPLREKIPFGMTKEERTRVNEIIRRCRY